MHKLYIFKLKMINMLMVTTFASLFLVGCGKEESKAANVDLEIAAVYIYKGDLTNLCTKYAPGDLCYLKSARIDKFSEKLLQLTYEWHHINVDSEGTDVTDSKYSVLLSPDIDDIYEFETVIDRFVLRDDSTDGDLVLKFTWYPFGDPRGALFHKDEQINNFKFE